MIVYGVMIDGAALEHDDTRYFYSFTLTESRVISQLPPIALVANYHSPVNSYIT